MKSRAAVASVIGGLFGSSALTVAGAAAALVVPVATLTALRVLDHATDRTQPPTADDPPGPAQAWRPRRETDRGRTDPPARSEVEATREPVPVEATRAPVPVEATEGSATAEATREPVPVEAPVEPVATGGGTGEPVPADAEAESTAGPTP